MVVKDDFAGRVLPLDQPAAEAAGRIDADRSKSGRPVGNRDTMISGIATSNGFGIVTRNVSDFHSLDVPVFNPFLAPL